MDDRICKMHNKTTELAELYRRTDQACICALCFKTSHRGHNVISPVKDYEAMTTDDEAEKRERSQCAGLHSLDPLHSEKAHRAR